MLHFFVGCFVFVVPPIFVVDFVVLMFCLLLCFLFVCLGGSGCLWTERPGQAVLFHDSAAVAELPQVPAAESHEARALCQGAKNLRETCG